MSEREERKNQRLGILSSIGIHVILILLFVFAMGWRAPDPPLSEMGSGIELNFGLDDQGGGEIQPDNPVGAEESVTPEKTEDSDQPKQEEKIKEEATPETSKVEEPLTSKEESTVAVKETKKEIKVTKPAVEKPAEDKGKDNIVAAKKEEKKSSKEADTRKVTEEKKGTAGLSHGDDKGKTGDKGNPQGTLDAKALYGNPGHGGEGSGGGGGAGISIEGFAGFEKPSIAKPEIPNESYGKYSFRVKVSRDGEVVSIVPITKGISLEAERIFKETIEKIIFDAKNSNSAESEGTITFNVVAPPTRN